MQHICSLAFLMVPLSPPGRASGFAFRLIGYEIWNSTTWLIEDYKLTYSRDSGENQVVFHEKGQEYYFQCFIWQSCNDLTTIMNDAKEGYQTYVVGPVKQRWNLGGLGGKMIPVVTCYYNCQLSLYFHTCPYILIELSYVGYDQ